MAPADGVAKKKGPPKFQHLPVNRARKLKQTWVKTAKIKSQWKAEKKRAGLMDASAGGGSDTVEEKEKTVGPSSGEIRGKGEDVDPETMETTLAFFPQDRHSKVLQPELETKDHIRRTSYRKAPVNPTSTIRDLEREAYSRSSLHTYKSDVHRRRGTGEESRRGKGRGQPNMKLRLNAMLEKIKRDFT